MKHLSARTKFKQVMAQAEWEPLPASGEAIGATLPHGALIGKTGLILPDKLTEAEWGEVGLAIAERSSACQWALADWWAFGAHTYRSKTAEALAAKITLKPETLMNWGSVARKIPTSRRNEALSFSHHVAVASLDPEEQERFLSKAENRKWSVKKLREMVLNRRELVDKEPSTEVDNFISRAIRSRPNYLSLNFGNSISGDALEALIREVSVTADQWSKCVAKLQAQRRSESNSKSNSRERIRFQQAAE